MRDLFFSQKMTKFSAVFLLAAAIAALTGCSAGTTPTSSTTTTTTAAAPTITIALTPTNSIGPGVNATVTATLKDAAGAGITGAVIAFSANSTLGQLNPASALTVNGVATATLSAAASAPPGGGADSVVATVQSVPSIASVPATAIGLSASTGYAVGGAVAPTVGSVTVTSSAASLTADGSSSATISATVKDTAGAVISGATVTFNRNAGLLSQTTANTNASGIAQVTLTAPTTKGNGAVTASSGGSSNSVNITFVPGAPANIVLTLSPSATAPGGIVTINAIVTDQYNNVVVAGQTVNFASTTGGLGSSTGGIFSPTSAVTNVIGDASTTYIAGSCTVATCTDILTVTSGTGALNTINLTINSSNSSVASISVTAGNTSITADGASYSAISATVTNSSGAGVQGVAVAFAATAGKLSSTAPTITVATTAATDASGVAKLYLIAPITTGNATVTANTSGYSNSINVTYIPGPPAAIGLNAQPATVRPGGSVQLTAAALDAQSNPVGAGQTINFSIVAATTTTTGGGFSTASGLTDANGIVNVTYTAGACAGASCTATLKASATNALVTSSTAVTVSSTAVVVNSLAVAATNSSIKVTGGGTPTSTVINATVKDTLGQPIPGATVAFATTAGGLTGITATNASGIASATLTSGSTVMTAVVSANISGFQSSTNVAFTAGAASAISLNAAPNAVKPGGASAITASVLDATSNPVVGEPVTFSFTSKGSGTPTLSATSATTDVNGLATVNYTAGAGVGSDVITAITSNSKTPGTPATITVSNSSVVVGSISTTASNGSIAANGGTTTVRATVLDATGIAMPGITVTFAASAGALSPATATTNASGIAQTTLTASGPLLTATVSASAGGFTSSTPVVFTAGTANTVTVSAAPTTLNQGGSSTVYAYVVDTFGNPVSGETVSFAISTIASGLPTLSSATAVTNVNGIASVTYTAGTTGGTTDIVKATTSNAKTGTVTVNVNAAASAVVGGLTLVSGAASLPTGGATTVINATVTDTAGAPMAGVAVSFQTSAGTLLPVLPVTTGSNGVAQVTLTSSNNLGTANISANASGFSRTTSVNFVASNPSAINLSASPATVSSGASSNLSASIIDAQGNPVAGQTVTFSIVTNISGGTLGSVTSVTDANGIATTAYTAGSATGTDTLKAMETSGLNNTTSIAVTASTVPTAASLTLAATPATIKTDNSNFATVTVTALSATNAVIPNVVVTLGANTGVLSAQTVTTGPNGQATFTFYSGVTSQFNRTASITATAGATTKTLPVPITGSTLTLTTATNSISTGTPATLTATAKDAGGNPASGQTVSFTVASGSGTLSAVTATTNAIGVATTDFTATAAGAASVKTDWMNTATIPASTISATQSFTAATAGTAFGLITPASSPFAVTLGTTQAVTVNVPATILAIPVVSVRFTTSLGSWVSSGTKTQTVLFGVAGNYTETFQTFVPTFSSYAGNANVQIDALDASGAILISAQAVLSLSASAASASTISLQANVTSISPSTGGTSSTATLTAMVRDAGGNPVGNAPVLFELLNPSGSGEQVTPVTVMTAAIATNGQTVGQALSTFIAGTLPTTQASQIQASVIGSSPVVSSITTITVGGTAGSIAIGTSSAIASVNSNTAYQLPVTVMVTDSNGNAVAGATVSLSLWATEYAKGVRGALCAVTYDAAFLNEDSNENLILDAGEDVDGPGGHIAGGSTTPPFIGTPDGVLWPPSSAAGSVPQTVTTGADGTVSFNLTYLKDYASWLIIRLRAKTMVQGTEATSVFAEALPISVLDATDPCSLTNSPFN